MAGVALKLKTESGRGASFPRKSARLPSRHPLSIIAAK
jgi:hypothetical protein